MRLAIVTITCLAGLILPGCGPTLNWRETPIAATSLTALFPCKPQKTSRRLALAGQQVELFMTGCDTGGITLAVGHATMPDPRMAGLAMAQWREAALAGVRAKSSTDLAWRFEQALQFPPPVRVQAIGARPNGRVLILQAAWFARDAELFGALVVGESLGPEVVDTFFSGLKFR